jgi:hypothetical protein
MRKDVLICEIRTEMDLTTINQRGLEVSSANALFMGKPFPSPIAQARKKAIERFVEFFWFGLRILTLAGHTGGRLLDS